MHKLLSLKMLILSNFGISYLIFIDLCIAAQCSKHGYNDSLILLLLPCKCCHYLFIWYSKYI